MTILSGSAEAPTERASERMEQSSAAHATVCVTGASGFFASCLVKHLLLSGYHVKATVRDPGDSHKVAHLRRLEGAEGRLHLVKADLMEEGSFDDAVAGCAGVFHTASPVAVVKSDPKAEMLDPAVAGTINVLRSCKKNTSLRRVVLTSSTAAVRYREDADAGKVPLDETSWSSAELCKRLKLWYALAKVLAERAAWRFAEENGIDLVTVQPSFIVGASLPPQLSTTASDVLELLQGETEKFSAFHGRMGYVHIDDAARCHVLVYEDRSARGRYLCNSVTLETHELVSLLAECYPSLPIRRMSEVPRDESAYYELDTSKLQKMGFHFKGINEMFDDFIESAKKHGYEIQYRPEKNASQ